MYDMLSSAFTDTLKREGKTIYSYSDNTPYSVIFRKNSDKNKLVNRLSIFYPLNCGIHAGQLLNYGTKHFLTLNQETIENNVYYKSDIVETNAVINTVQDGIEVNMPVYVYDVSDALFEGNNYISYISGTFHIVAETNPTMTSLQINDTFYIIEKYVKVVNTFNKDNITNIYCQIELESNTYTVTITANDTYHRGETAQFTATAKQNDNPVENPQILWESSDSSLATVDSTGLVTFLADGNVSITATWVTHNVSDTKAVAITEPDTYSLVVNGEDSYTTGDTPTLTATAQTNGITDDTATITWISSDSNIATIDSTGLVTFLTAGEVTFTATWVEHDITATKAVTVTEASSMTCTVEYSGAAEVKMGTSKTFTAHFWNGSTELTDQTEEWSLVKPAGYEDKVTEKEDAAANTITITVSGKDMEIIGKHITLTLQDSNHTCSTTVDIKIVSLF
jgi:uncharacterized protein YjdB